MTGDRVQAKWEDGKMYFGKVLQVHEGIVIKMIRHWQSGSQDLCVCTSVCTQTWSMFYLMMVWSTLLLSELSGEGSVFCLFPSSYYCLLTKRLFIQRPDKPAEHNYDSSTDSSEAAEARRNRARKRLRDDDSVSQSSMSSPPSSPLTYSARKRPCRIVDSDSTETESDFDDPSHPHIREHQMMKPRGRGRSSSTEQENLLKPPVAPASDGECAPKMMDPSAEGGGVCPLPVAVSGSESEHPLPIKRGRGRPRKLREPYKLRKATMLDPVQENEVNALREGNVEAGGEEGGGKVVGGALLTPPSGDCTPHPKPIPKSAAPPVSPDKESPKQIPNPTPPETPQTDSHSESGILKRMLSQDESSTAAGQTKKTSPSQEGSNSPSSKKKSPVSSRTRAQTKFENVSSVQSLALHNIIHIHDCVILACTLQIFALIFQITKKVDKKDKKQGTHVRHE